MGKTTFFFQKIPDGMRLTRGYIVLIIAFALIGYFLFDFWFYLVIGATAFMVADLYFYMVIDYEANAIFFFTKRTENETVMFIAYFIGILLSGLASYSSSILLTNFGTQIKGSFLILIISFAITTGIALEIKAGMSNKTLPQESTIRT